MKIREFKSSDAKKVAELSNENSEVFQFPKVSPTFLKRMVSHPKFKLFILSEGSSVIGFCGLNFETLPIAEIGPIAVEKSRRQHGIGRLLVDDVLEFADELGAKKVIIKVKTSNTIAQEFFKSLGFKSIDKIICAEEPAILMQYGLE